MKLKRTYSSREVSALTGLTARQLQWWDSRLLFASAIPSHPTAAGGFTERRYSPVDLLELLVLADLRRHGFTLQKIRTLLDTLRERFGIRLFEAIGGGGPLTLLTDGQEVYLRTTDGEIVSLIRTPGQPLLAIGQEGDLKELSSRMRARRKPRKRASPKR
jgi:DNA-binding transcriptional MerR regulator